MSLRPRLALASVLLFGPLVLPGTAHDATPVPTPIRYYVHDFDPQGNFDAATREHSFLMNLEEPDATDQADPGTDARVAGDAQAIYVFRTELPLATPLDLSLAEPGEFLFWVRAYQAGGVPSTAPATRVTFQLRTDDGRLVADGNQTQDVSGADPVRFAVPWVPRAVHLDAGAHLRWTVNITNGPSLAPAYNPNAAPFGSTREHPFRLTLVHQVVPPPVPRLRLELLGPATVVANGREEARFPFRLHNDADEPDTANFALERLPPNATKAVLREGGDPISRLELPPLSRSDLVVSVGGLSVGGNVTFVFHVVSELGADLSQRLSVIVVPAAPTTSAKSPAQGFLGAVALLALATIVDAVRRRPG